MTFVAVLIGLTGVLLGAVVAPPWLALVAIALLLMARENRQNRRIADQLRAERRQPAGAPLFPPTAPPSQRIVYVEKPAKGNSCAGAGCLVLISLIVGAALYGLSTPEGQRAVQSLGSIVERAPATARPSAWAAYERVASVIQVIDVRTGVVEGTTQVFVFVTAHVRRSAMSQFTAERLRDIALEQFPRLWTFGAFLTDGERTWFYATDQTIDDWSFEDFTDVVRAQQR